MLLNHSFLSLSLNTSILWYLLFVPALWHSWYSCFSLDSHHAPLPGFPSLSIYCDSLGNSYTKGLMGPQLLFLGSVPNVFKWEKLGFQCKVFLWKLFFFPFEKHSERWICSSLLPMTKKQSVSEGKLLQALSCWLQYPWLLGFPAWTAQKKLGLSFR